MDRFVVRAKRKRKRAEPADGRPTVLELFAGCGGMALGLARAGFRHVALLERDRECVATLRANGWARVRAVDVNVADFREFAGVDVVAGGPPCQPYSIGGVDGGGATRATAGPRRCAPCARRARAPSSSKAWPACCAPSSPLTASAFSARCAPRATQWACTTSTRSTTACRSGGGA